MQTQNVTVWPFVAAMATIVVASNILVQFPFPHFGLQDLLTWGAFTYPIAFLVTDLTNRRFGPAAARKVVLVGFAIAIVLSVWLATPRIAIASGSAFLVAQLLDVAIFDRLRRNAWWQAPLISTVIGSLVDTALFSRSPSPRGSPCWTRRSGWKTDRWAFRCRSWVRKCRSGCRWRSATSS